TSSVAQADLMEALGARPIIIPFAQIVPAIRGGLVDCAITGTLSGFAIGLHEVTSHVHMMAISWGLSAFAVHRPTWRALPADVRDALRRGLAELEAEIWRAAERETEEGLQCNAGQAGCPAGRAGRMRLVPVSADDEARRSRLLREVVLPRWLDRCGPGCADAWNATLAPLTGLELTAP
ncbi:MAG: TRAP transporter substrate-binding protein DctP, partial [Rhodovarius sp.]|nr:TRAP transporter substrate-binding protein DctP [Rhodovarius sp.]